MGTLTSQFINSKWGDERLFFRHQRWEDDWKKISSGPDSDKERKDAWKEDSPDYCGGGALEEDAPDEKDGCSLIGFSTWLRNLFLAIGAILLVLGLIIYQRIRAQKRKAKKKKEKEEAEKKKRGGKKKKKKKKKK